MRGTKPNLVSDPKGMAAIPRPPAWLCKDGKAEWRRVVPPLVERRILTDADLGTLEAYCNAYGVMRTAQRELAASSLVFVTPSGQMKRNPAAGIVAEFSNLYKQLGAELGCTPVSRSRPAIRDDQAGDDDGLDL